LNFLTFFTLCKINQRLNTLGTLSLTKLPPVPPPTVPPSGSLIASVVPPNGLFPNLGKSIITSASSSAVIISQSGFV